MSTTTPAPSRSVIVVAIIAIAAFATGAVMFIQGDSSLQRLGLLFGLFGALLPGLLGALKADAAAKSTDTTSSIAQALNGGFEARVRHSARQVRDEQPGTMLADTHAAADAETAAALTASAEGKGLLPPV
jgi:hypothetical protein